MIQSSYMAVKPIQCLVSPRIIAGLICMPLLTSVFNVAGIYGGHMVGVALLDVSSGTYFEAMERSVVFHDVFTGFLKSVTFWSDYHLGQLLQRILGAA